LALAWDDVDLDDGILRVRRTVQRLRGQGLVFGPPKSTRSRRSIPLPESSRAALLSHRERQEVERLTAGDSWQESGLVFTTSVGTVVEPRNLSRTFEHLVQQSGVRRIRLLSRPGAQCRCCHRSGSPGRSPNPSCQFLGNGLSTVAAVRRDSWVARG
jgi:integrase